MQEMDGEVFLANENNGSIYHLNAIGSALWRMLEDPCSLETIIKLFINAFPDQSRKDLNQDIKALINQLEEHQLIIGE
jgi:hypothetical protein